MCTMDDAQGASGARKGTGPHIVDRALPKNAPETVSTALFTYLFSEMVQYCHSRVQHIADLEEKLAVLGRRVGRRALEICLLREKRSKREIRVVEGLIFVQTNLWRSLFGRPGSPLEKENTEQGDTYMFSDHDLIVNRYVSVPSEFGSLNCGSFVAGMLEAALEGLGFLATVSSHATEKGTTMLIKLDPSVMAREKRMS